MDDKIENGAQPGTTESPITNEDELLLDKHGFPLVPQPSANSMDPLNWSYLLKIAVLAQVSLISFLSLLSAAMIVCNLFPSCEIV